MLKTLDILIGATTVLLLFSMALTVITQMVTSILSKRGEHLLGGLASLLQLLGISSRDIAEQIARVRDDRRHAAPDDRLRSSRLAADDGR